MTLPPLPLVDNTLFIDNSLIEQLSTCPTQAVYSWLMKRTSVKARPALSFGEAAHLALEHHYRGATEDEQVRVLTDYFAKHPQPEDDHRTLDYAVELFVTRYNRRYVTEPFKLLYADAGFGDITGPLIEMPFALPLFDADMGSCNPDIHIFYCGRIDLPVLWDNRLVIIDHKTTSMLGPYYFDEQRISPQMDGYCWSFEQLTGKKVDGFCTNAIRTAKKPIYVEKWEQTKSIIDDFSNQEHIVDSGNGKTKKTDPRKWWEECYQREPVPLRPGRLEEWRLNTIALIEEFLWNYQRGFVPMKRKWCCGKYGHCQYYEVDDVSEEHRQKLLDSGMFIDNEWSPLRKPTPV